MQLLVWQLGVVNLDWTISGQSVDGLGELEAGGGSGQVTAQPPLSCPPAQPLKSHFESYKERRGMVAENR